MLLKGAYCVGEHFVDPQCSKVIHTGLIKTEIGNWNSDVYFHQVCAICKKSWWKAPEISG